MVAAFEKISQGMYGGSSPYTTEGSGRGGELNRDAEDLDDGGPPPAGYYEGLELTESNTEVAKPLSPAIELSDAFWDARGTVEDRREHAGRLYAERLSELEDHLDVGEGLIESLRAGWSNQETSVMDMLAARLQLKLQEDQNQTIDLMFDEELEILRQIIAEAELGNEHMKKDGQVLDMARAMQHCFKIYRDMYQMEKVAKSLYIEPVYTTAGQEADQQQSWQLAA